MPLRCILNDLEFKKKVMVIYEVPYCTFYTWFFFFSLVLTRRLCRIVVTHELTSSSVREEMSGNEKVRKEYARDWVDGREKERE